MKKFLLAVLAVSVAVIAADVKPAAKAEAPKAAAVDTTKKAAAVDTAKKAAVDTAKKVEAKKDTAKAAAPAKK